MTNNSQPTKRSGAANIASWVLRIVVALAFGGAAFLKLSGNPKMVAEFGEIGFGQGFRYLTAAIEMLGAVLLLVPRTVRFGVLLLLGICGGALVAHLKVIHGDLTHVFVLGALLVLIGWLTRRD